MSGNIKCPCFYNKVSTFHLNDLCQTVPQAGLCMLILKLHLYTRHSIMFSPYLGKYYTHSNITFHYTCTIVTIS